MFVSVTLKITRGDLRRKFLEPRFKEAGKFGSEMIKAVMETEVMREEEERRHLSDCKIARRVHSIPLGYLQPCRTSHCFHIQTGQNCFCHSFCRTPYLSQGRRRDRNIPSGRIQEHT